LFSIIFFFFVLLQSDINNTIADALYTHFFLFLYIRSCKVLNLYVYNKIIIIIIMLYTYMNILFAFSRYYFCQ